MRRLGLGGGLFNKIQNVFVEDSVFRACSADDTGAGLAFLMDADYDADISISGSTRFIDNTATVGAGIFASQHRLAVITQPQHFEIDGNLSSQLNADLDTVDIEGSYDAEYVFMQLTPLNLQHELLWSYDFVWNDSWITVRNAQHQSTVDNKNGFISPLFIPLAVCACLFPLRECRTHGG